MILIIGVETDSILKHDFNPLTTPIVGSWMSHGHTDIAIDLGQVYDKSQTISCNDMK